MKGLNQQKASESKHMHIPSLLEDSVSDEDDFIIDIQLRRQEIVKQLNGIQSLEQFNKYTKEVRSWRLNLIECANKMSIDKQRYTPFLNEIDEVLNAKRTYFKYSKKLNNLRTMTKA